MSGCHSLSVCYRTDGCTCAYIQNKHGCGEGEIWPANQWASLLYRARRWKACGRPPTTFFKVCCVYNSSLLIHAHLLSWWCAAWTDIVESGSGLGVFGHWAVQQGRIILTVYETLLSVWSREQIIWNPLMLLRTYSESFMHVFCFYGGFFCGKVAARIRVYSVNGSVNS